MHEKFRIGLIKNTSKSGLVARCINDWFDQATLLHVGPKSCRKLTILKFCYKVDCEPLKYKKKNLDSFFNGYFYRHFVYHLNNLYIIYNGNKLNKKYQFFGVFYKDLLVP